MSAISISSWTIHFFTFFLVIWTTSLAGVAVPKLEKRVTDLANLLSPQTIAYLTKELEAEEQKSSNQLAVLILPSLEGEPINDVAIQVYDEWKLGQKDKNNGILFLIAPNERKMRIEVGRGLEGFLPDVICNRIIKQVVRPEFKNGNYDQGVILGIQSILMNLDNSYIPSNTDVATTKKKRKNMSISSMLGGIVLGLILALIASRLDGTARLVVLFISLFLLVGVFTIFFSYAISLAISIFLQVISFLLGNSWKRNGSGGSDGSGYAGGWGGGFYGGGSSWGGGDSSWSGDSSWGGGGGDSGGGGASGDW